MNENPYESIKPTKQSLSKILLEKFVNTENINNTAKNKAITSRELIKRLRNSSNLNRTPKPQTKDESTYANMASSESHQQIYTNKFIVNNSQKGMLSSSKSKSMEKVYADNYIQTERLNKKKDHKTKKPTNGLNVVINFNNKDKENTKSNKEKSFLKISIKKSFSDSQN